MMILFNVVAAILAFGILVTIHEYGHFWVARRAGVKIQKFSIGFGSSLISWYDKQGTEFVIAAIPLGGYVKMQGEGDAAGEESDPAAQVDPNDLSNFSAQPVGARIAIMAAGPAVNLVFAVLVFWAFYSLYPVTKVLPVVGVVEEQGLAAEAGLQAKDIILALDGESINSWKEVELYLLGNIGETRAFTFTVDRSGIELDLFIHVDRWMTGHESEYPLGLLGVRPFFPESPALVDSFAENSAAQAQGMRAGDQITAINGNVIDSWQSMAGVVSVSANQLLNITLIRTDKSVVTLPVKVAVLSSSKGVEKGFLGIKAKMPKYPDSMIETIHYNPVTAVIPAVKQTGELVAMVLLSVKKMLTGDMSLDALSGPITVAKVAGEQAQRGLDSYIYFLALFSVSLGVLNLLPIPLLDGGHLMYFSIELITGKALPEKVQRFGMVIGGLFVISITVLAVYKDILRFN